MRRLLTYLLVSGATALGSLWWLHEGDLRSAVEPLPSWDAAGLASQAGFPRTQPARFTGERARDTEQAAP